MTISLKCPLHLKHKSNTPFRKTWKARLVQLPSPTGEIKGFITSCLCPEKYALKELVDVYWQPWEIERGYGELKQYQLVNKPLLRSLKSDGIYQELWGILTSYNIIRLEMAEMAKQHKVEPLRISFVNALYLIQDEFNWSDSAETPRVQYLRR